MKINQKCNGTVNPKTGKKYSLDFKNEVDEMKFWRVLQDY